MESIWNCCIELHCKLDLVIELVQKLFTTDFVSTVIQDSSQWYSFSSILVSALFPVTFKSRLTHMGHYCGLCACPFACLYITLRCVSLLNEMSYVLFGTLLLLAPGQRQRRWVWALSTPPPFLRPFTFWPRRSVKKNFLVLWKRTDMLEKGILAEISHIQVLGICTAVVFLSHRVLILRC